MNGANDLSCPATIVGNWDELCRVYREHAAGTFSSPNNKSIHWIFRGDKRSRDSYSNDLCETCGKNIIDCLCPQKYLQISVKRTDLRTHLEKGFDNYGVNKRQDVEKALIRSFQRKASLYINSPPALDDTAEWLALMAHYGAPTRLLDCTYSFFVATYMAVNRLDCTSEVAEVWSINASWLTKATKPKLPEEPESTDFTGLLAKQRSRTVARLVNDPIPLVYNVTPFRMNKRITAQQGTFLCPGDIGVSFVENLRACADDPRLSSSNLNKVIVSVCPEQRNEILRQLCRMNIEQATLFPDLEGFAKSLWGKLAYPEIFGLNA